MLLARRTLFCASLIALAACSESTGPLASSATVTVTSSSLAATRTTAGGITWIQFSVPVRIENTGTTTLKYEHCSEQVEARTGTSWSVAWTPICSVTLDRLALIIPPGESREFTEAVQAAVSGPGGPPWLASAGAPEFRFVAVLSPNTTGRLPVVASNSFTLAIGN